MKKEHFEKYRKMGLKINYYRRLKNLTQEELAEMIDKSPSFLGAVEAPNVARTLSLDTLFDIAEALDVPPYKFLVDD
ncbi:MAG: helix-turn-helix transcriptional regulator [Ruminococcus sp.]|nr:helix-turn-helix transcriptional regulator [Ruminococcus sp.]MDE7225374.1 helix-turn-helix transcriptional regulator [Ruminococcus sp.]